jgi:translation initiation factor 2B subunit (eIF-2B alpha/beta/delta family)
VVATASEPGGEGRRLAQEIGAACIEDTAVGEHLHDVDLVLVGADAVLANDDFVNKIGTRAIAAAAGQRGVPFYVVFESFKRLAENKILLDEPVFELTPAAAVTEHITDGVFQEPPSPAAFSV